MPRRRAARRKARKIDSDSDDEQDETRVDRHQDLRDGIGQANAPSRGDHEGSNVSHASSSVFSSMPASSASSASSSSATPFIPPDNANKAGRSSKQAEFVLPTRGRIEENDGNTLRILISTDNHLGYMGNDTIRREDSYLAFKEVLESGVTTGADMVLLGGDLFHDNKPGRGCIHRAITLLRRYCLGDGDVAIQMCSDQEKNFRGEFRRVNYEDPNYNIGLPVFSIHGNHDDPTREGGLSSLSANDILSAANLVNYFGTAEHLDAIKIYPLLITKGNTRLALYGLGAMRDERLNRLFVKKKVTFVRPSGQAEPWFSVFVVHQNRDKGRGAKSCVHESMIPSWMDIVVWGHEHECLIEPQESTAGYFITQPGSTVATSLVEGEAVQKHICTLDIRLAETETEPSFKLTSIPLKLVRPFMMEEMDLELCEDLKGVDPNDQQVGEIISNVLREKVDEMILQAQQEYDLKNGFPGMMGRDKDGNVLPLIRLRVFRGQFQTLNIQRFGSQYLGRVANPKSMLQFARKKQVGQRGGRKRRLGGIALDADDIGEFDLNDSGASKARVGEIVSLQLRDKATKLTLLPEQAFTEAVNQFVEKEESRAITDFVEATLAKMQRSLANDDDAELVNDPEKFEKVVAKRTEKVDKAMRAIQREKERKLQEAEDYGDDGEHGKQNKRNKKKTKKTVSRDSRKTKTRKRKLRGGTSSDSESSEESSSSISHSSEDDESEDGQEEAAEGDKEHTKTGEGGGKRVTSSRARRGASGKKQQLLSFQRKKGNLNEEIQGEPKRRTSPRRKRRRAVSKNSSAAGNTVDSDKAGSIVDSSDGSDSDVSSDVKHAKKRVRRSTRSRRR